MERLSGIHQQESLGGIHRGANLTTCGDLGQRSALKAGLVDVDESKYVQSKERNQWKPLFLSIHEGQMKI